MAGDTKHSWARPQSSDASPALLHKERSRPHGHQAASTLEGVAAGLWLQSQAPHSTNSLTFDGVFLKTGRHERTEN